MKLSLSALRQRVGPLPAVGAEAIVVHWTAGAARASPVDLKHYHFVVDQKSRIHEGNHSIADNVPPMTAGHYAAHCLSFNGRFGKAVIGVSATGMAGCTESPFTSGPHPITEDQIETLAYLVAFLCIEYNVPVTPIHVLMHGEVQKNRGIQQRGKWDICRLPYAPHKQPNQVCAEFRAAVEAAKADLLGKPKRAPRLFLSLDGRAAVSVPGAVLSGATWTASATAMRPILGEAFQTRAQESPLSTVPVRLHLERSGYAIDEAKTAAHQFLSDSANPRQMIVAVKAKTKTKTDGKPRN